MQVLDWIVTVCLWHFIIWIIGCCASLQSCMFLWFVCRKKVIVCLSIKVNSCECFISTIFKIYKKLMLSFWPARFVYERKNLLFLVCRTSCWCVCELPTFHFLFGPPDHGVTCKTSWLQLKIKLKKRLNKSKITDYELHKSHEQKRHIEKLNYSL